MISKKDEKQNIELAEIKKDIDYLQKDINSIKTQVFNHLPAAIKELSEKFQKYKDSNSKWLIGILVTMLFILIGTVINLLK